MWKSQLGRAADLLKDIDEALPVSIRPSPASASTGVQGPMARHAFSRLPAQADLGREASQPLDANLMDARTLVMAMPGNKSSASWAAACLRQNIRAVIDVSSTGVMASEQSCMKSNAPWEKDDAHVEFRCPLANGMFPLERMVRQSELPAWERQVGVRLAVNGQEVPLANGQPRAPSEWNNGKSRAPLEMTWLRMPMEAGQAVSPRAMLELCRHAERLTGPDAMCAFQSADGGRRAALLAVAQDVYRTLGRMGCSEAQQLDAITEACVRARERVSVDVVNQPEELASLLAMTRLMSQESDFSIPRARH